MRWGFLVAAPFLLACDGDDEAAEPTPSSAATSTTTSAPATTTTPVPAGIPPERGFSTEELFVTFPPEPGRQEGATYLTDVRLGVGQGYERLTFQFDQAVPPVHVHYEEEPFETSDAGCSVPRLAEGRVVTVSFHGTATHEFSPDPNSRGRPTYTGSERLRSRDTRLIVEAVLSCEFEAEVEWAVVLRERRPFRAMTLSAPPRFVLDVQTTP